MGVGAHQLVGDVPSTTGIQVCFGQHNRSSIAVRPWLGAIERPPESPRATGPLVSLRLICHEPYLTTRQQVSPVSAHSRPTERQLAASPLVEPFDRIFRNERVAYSLRESVGSNPMSSTNALVRAVLPWSGSPFSVIAGVSRSTDGSKGTCCAPHTLERCPSPYISTSLATTSGYP